MNQQLAYLLLTNDGVLGLLSVICVIQKGSSYKFSMEIKYASMSERKKNTSRRILNAKYLRSSFLHRQGSMSFQGQVSHPVPVAERFLTFYSYIGAWTNTNTHHTVQPQHTPGNYHEEILREEI